MRTIAMCILVTILAVPALAQTWPKTPPPVGRLYLKQEYWDYIKEAARKYNLSPYLIQAVCAIESRYDMDARSGHGNCIGLMQLHKDTARLYGVNPFNPRDNIMGGAAVLAKFMERYNGDIHRVLTSITPPAPHLTKGRLSGLTASPRLASLPRTTIP